MRNRAWFALKIFSIAGSNSYLRIETGHAESSNCDILVKRTMRVCRSHLITSSKDDLSTRCSVYELKISWNLTPEMDSNHCLRFCRPSPRHSAIRLFKMHLANARALWNCLFTPQIPTLPAQLRQRLVQNQLWCRLYVLYQLKPLTVLSNSGRLLFFCG